MYLNPYASERSSNDNSAAFPTSMMPPIMPQSSFTPNLFVPSPGTSYLFYFLVFFKFNCAVAEVTPAPEETPASEEVSKQTSVSFQNRRHFSSIKILTKFLVEFSGANFGYWCF